MDAGASKMVLGVVVGSLATKFFTDSKPSNKTVEGCVYAYYADKYNGVREGKPDATFVTCMAAQNQELFKRIKKDYLELHKPQDSQGASN
jgi:hypothetical protein